MSPPPLRERLIILALCSSRSHRAFTAACSFRSSCWRYASGAVRAVNEHLVLHLLIDHLLHRPPARALLRPRGGDDGGQPADQVLDIRRTEGRARRPQDTPHHASHPRAIGRI